MPPLINFLNPLALGLSLLLVPIIILYLLKPKPKKVKFPSIMFISRIDQSKRFSSFFRKFIRDPLLLVQLFILLLLILSLASPYFLSSEVKNPRENAVFVFDGSASMQATDVSPSRFKKAQEVAKEIIGKLHPQSKISLIFAGKAPILLLKESTKEKAQRVVENLQVTDAPSNLEDAILFGNDLLSSQEKGFQRKIYLLSDFSHVGDIKLGKGISLHQGIQVESVKVNKRGENVGIISINGKRFQDERDMFYLTAVVKNFNPESRKVTLEIFLDEKLMKSEEREIASNSSSLFYWKGKCSPQEHQIRAEIKEKDALSLDNKGYWILPKIRKYNLLLITNQDSYLKYALESNPDFSLNVAQPPVIPKIKGKDYDAVILGNFDPDLMLPGTFLGLRDYVERGGNLILLASEGLYHQRGNENLKHILPLELEEVISAKSVVKKEREHEILEDVTLDNVILEKYISSERKSNQSEVVATCKGSPLVVLDKRNRRKVAYIGINSEPQWSNFYLSSSHPVLWFQLVKWMNKEKFFSIRNYKAGQHVFFKEENVTLTNPSGRTFKVEEIILDEVGIYQANNSKRQPITVNLESEEESSISHSTQVKTLHDENFNLVTEETWEKNFLWKYLVIVALIFIIIEAILYKRRGLI